MRRGQRRAHVEAPEVIADEADTNGSTMSSSSQVLALPNARAARAAVNGGFDLEAAEQFLGLLRATRCTFQTFDDNAQRKDRKLAIILYGSLAEHTDTLQHLNGLGAGIFIAVNQTDGQGRKRENIKRVRAVTLDLDGEPLDPVKLCVLKPHMIVESSPGRYHAYWRVKGLAIDQFEDVQRAIAKRFDGDPAVAKLTHVARLCLHHYRGSFYRWVGTHYAEIDTKEVRSQLYGFLADALTSRSEAFQPFNPTPNKVNAIMDAL